MFMFNNNTVSAVVVAAGAGTRMGAEVNKVFLALGRLNTPALLYSLSAFQENHYVDEIVLVVRPQDEEAFEGLRAYPQFPIKPLIRVFGGQQRYDSVFNGVSRASGGIVLIHDGARPLLRQRYIDECVEAMEEFPGAIVAIPSRDRICVLGDDGCLVPRVTRERFYRAQTPQCFRRELYLECFESAKDKTAVTDDSGLLEICGYKVKLIPGDETNIKLTAPEDMIVAERWLEGLGR